MLRRLFSGRLEGEWTSSSRCGVHLTSWASAVVMMYELTHAGLFGEGLAPIELEAVGVGAAGAGGHPLGGLAVDAHLVAADVGVPPRETSLRTV